MRGAYGRRYRFSAGNWPPYVRACLRKGLRFRALALGISLLGAAFFAAALWLARQGQFLLGITTFQAGLACLGLLAAAVGLALDLRAARKEASPH